MKKIINGKVYDTDKAAFQIAWENDYGRRDFKWAREELYLKRTGEFFLYGEGGPMTRYAHRCSDNSWSGGEEITPMTYEEAREWAESHLDANDYEKIFGEVTEDDSQTTITISLPASVVEAAKREAQKSGMTFSAYIASKLA